MEKSYSVLKNAQEIGEKVLEVCLSTYTLVSEQT